MIMSPKPSIYVKKTFVAKTHRPCLHFPGPLEEKMCLGFNQDPERKIDVFRVGSRKNTDTLTNPDELNINSLKLHAQPAFSFQLFGLSKEDENLYEKFEQLGLLFVLCAEENLKPGLDIETDRKIIEKLRVTLSENIINKEEVIDEFVRLWNEVASSTLASSNLEIPPAEATHTIFKYNENYVRIVQVFGEGLIEKGINSPAYIDMLKNILSIDNPSLLAIAKTQATCEISRFMACNLLNPQPLDLATTEIFTAITNAISALTAPAATSQEITRTRNQLENDLTRVDNLCRENGYTPYRTEQRREREGGMQVERRERSLSPQSHKDKNTPRG